MKTKILSILALLLMTVTQGAWAQETLTVYDGTKKYSFSPAYMYAFDWYTRSQYIIPAANLEAMNGKIITALKYYSSTSNVTSTCNVDVYLKEVSYTTFDENTPTFETKSGIVYTGTLSIAGDGTLTITFTTPYTYNGGNLLIGMENTEKGNDIYSSFYGQNVTGAVAFGSNSTSLAAVTANRNDFIPKTTFTYETPDPNAGLLTGRFSVSATKQVQFSQGNLQYDGSAWSFHTNQYDCVFTSISTATDYPMDIFCWGNIDNPAYDGSTGIGTNGVDLSGSSDWGSNTITNGCTGWRTLTLAEWEYLFANHSYGYATVAGQTGVIILPDVFTDPMRNNGSAAFVASTASWTANVYAAGDDWTAMEKAGALFLPAAGGRDGSYIGSVGIKGSYWSSTAYTTHGRFIVFQAGSAPETTNYSIHGYGKSVRLVKDYIFTGLGTEASPYLIASTTDWNNLSAAVNAGTEYSGIYFKLTANISVTTMIGASDKPFRGSFDGGGHTLTVNYTASAAGTAPFPRTASTTLIKNLRVAGTITGGGFKVAGLVSEPVGATIEHCRVSATISANTYHGLWIGGFCNGGNVTINNCLFDGKINCVGGGFIGYSETTSRITNCLFSPQTGSSLGSSQDGNGVFIYTKGRESNLGTITNCYYTSLAGGVAQGTDGSGLSAVQLVQNLGASNWKVVGGNAIPKVHPNLSGEGTEASPYLIASTTDWNNLVSAVNAGETYSGNYFKMTANVGTVSTWMTGTFSGIFDGDGKTLTVDYSATTEKCAPFGTLGGASIQKLKVAGTITTNQKYAAGIAAYTTGTTYITNCLSSVAISSAVSGDGTHGGLVAVVDDVASLSMTGCAFTGKLLTTNSTTSCGGFVGFRWYTGTLTMTDCLYAPASATGSETWISDGEGQLGNANFSRWSNSTPTFTRCYYTTDFGSGNFTAQGTQARTIAAGDYVSSLSVTKGDATETYAVSGITVYSGGIDFNDGSTTTFYGGSGQTVSLALTPETRSGYQFKQYAASQGSLSDETTDTPTLTMPAASGETLYTTYTATAGPDGVSDKSGYAKLVDNDKSTKVCATFTSGVYIDFNTPNAIVPTGYVITTANDASSTNWYKRTPVTWKLYGKLNEGDSWTVLDDVADGNLPNEDTTDKSYSIANTAAYKYFRYEISAIKGSTELFQLAELQLKGYDAVVISAEYDPTYNATFASGNDNTDWTIDPASGVAGTSVTVSYTGENKVKSVTVTNKYAIAHSLAASVVGDIVGTDGLAYSVAEKGKLPVGVTAAGVVTYKSGETGIVVALQNLATQYSWSDAFTAAAAYTPAVSGQTWKLGTKDEMSNAILNDYTIKYGYITAAGGTFPYPNNYWSATEVDGNTDWAWRIWVESNGVPTWHDWDGVTKATECQVRPIIAF